MKVARDIFKNAVDTKVNPIDYLILIQSDASQFLSVPDDLRYDHAFKVDALTANHNVLAFMTLDDQCSLINSNPGLLVYASSELFQTKEITDLLLLDIDQCVALWHYRRNDFLAFLMKRPDVFFKVSDVLISEYDGLEQKMFLIEHVLEGYPQVIDRFFHSDYLPTHYSRVALLLMNWEQSFFPKVLNYHHALAFLVNHSDLFKQFVIKSKPEVIAVLHGWMDHDAWLILAIASCRYDAWHIRRLPDYLWSDKDFIIKIVSPGGQCVYEAKANVVQHIAQNLQQDMEFMMQCLAINHDVFYYLNLGKVLNDLLSKHIEVVFGSSTKFYNVVDQLKLTQAMRRQVNDFIQNQLKLKVHPKHRSEFGIFAAESSAPASTLVEETNALLMP